MLATCAFPQFSPDMGIPVRITVGNPRFKLGYELRHKIKEAAPDAYTLKWDDKPRFRLHLIRKFNKTGVDEFRRMFADIAAAEDTTLDETTVVLLCFEDLGKPGLWCHRTMFAEWWTGETGELVPELGNTPTHTPGLF